MLGLDFVLKTIGDKFLILFGTNPKGDRNPV